MKPIRTFLVITCMAAMSACTTVMLAPTSGQIARGVESAEVQKELLAPGQRPGPARRSR